MDKNILTLADLPKRHEAKIVSIKCTDPALRAHILDMGLTPHVKVTMIKTAPLGDPLEIKVRGYVLTLRKNEAQKILITDIKKIHNNFLVFDICLEGVKTVLIVIASVLLVLLNNNEFKFLLFLLLRILYIINKIKDKLNPIEYVKVYITGCFFCSVKDFEKFSTKIKEIKRTPPTNIKKRNLFVFPKLIILLLHDIIYIK